VKKLFFTPYPLATIHPLQTDRHLSGQTDDNSCQ